MKRLIAFFLMFPISVNAQLTVKADDCDVFQHLLFRACFDGMTEMHCLKYLRSKDQTLIRKCVQKAAILCTSHAKKERKKTCAEDKRPGMGREIDLQEETGKNSQGLFGSLPARGEGDHIHPEG